MVSPKIATIFPPFSIFITTLIQATHMSQLREHSRLTLSFHFCPPKIYSSYSNQVIKTQNGSCYSCALIPSTALHCCEKNNLNFLLKYLIWPLITSWTSSGASLPSLLFSLPQRSQPLPCPLTALPCAWNPISYAWLLHGSRIFFRVSGRHFKTTLLKEKNQSLFNLSILFFLHILSFSLSLKYNIHTVKYLKPMKFKLTVPWVLHMSTFLALPPAPSSALIYLLLFLWFAMRKDLIIYHYGTIVEKQILTTGWVYKFLQPLQGAFSLY